MPTTIPGLKDLLKAGVHFGHSEGRWHPKAHWYIHSARSGVHIIDLEQSQKQLEHVLAYVEKIASEGKTILFVGTKRQAQSIVEEEATRAGMPFVTRRWLGGLLTNFTAMKPMLDRYRKLLSEQGTDAWEKYTKKERVGFEKIIAKKNPLLGGLKTLNKIPDALFVLDVRKEKTAIREAQVKGIPVIAICDSNINPEQVTHPIPGNDDAVKSIALLTKLVADAAAAGKVQAGIAKAAADALKEKEAAEKKEVVVEKKAAEKKEVKKEEPKAEEKKSEDKPTEESKS
ncbi:MAG: 30S ribosomal protein S2 [Parcubacteria group bacterium]|nr:30S ribosomal protein S2 [Parcubacteria group bacterium]